MRARSATFHSAAQSSQTFPAPTVPEIAFAGRSNVGKSSLINALTGVPKLAKTSSTPGRTRLINWFQVVAPSGSALRFVDLPGYGFARVSKEMRESWRKLVEDFVGARDVLKLVVVIVDLRRGAEVEERELLEWLADNDKPALVVATKVDKLAKAQRIPHAAMLRRQLALRKDPLCFSALTGDGVAALWRHIEACE